MIIKFPDTGQIYFSLKQNGIINYRTLLYKCKG